MLNVSEMYPAILGESTWAGQPCTIIRLGGCNLNCVWCDTKFAQLDFSAMSPMQIYSYCRKTGLDTVLVTGGEPLAQKETPRLLQNLVKKYRVILETNGTFSLKNVSPSVIVVLDVKCPSSGMAEHQCWENLELLKEFDEVKFGISHLQDFNYALDVVKKFDLHNRVSVLFSPIFGKLNPADLSAWILKTRLPIRLNIQWHKYIWSPDERRR
ncbi:MAG TPA: radical SAM protein [Candidatus Sumerlaeota bacterium]|nr:MAG: 7-carboxy-7-deazaguanine synthase [candidate division BRC1 bacterium ADurb.Bin183]HOE63861.1 radical SAM protein [Candidatus Sumerlaeota bacterium]HRR32115.1 radical SAM protein [Candidatus Sumerlaeia bacterium]HON49965.1 radical SAM protein [Candidatus Sumerlaeota bacterium]HOR63787.1 radical SAM protein [Candidatus Sumerlaeota bacterium]